MSRSWYVRKVNNIAHGNAVFRTDRISLLDLLLSVADNREDIYYNDDESYIEVRKDVFDNIIDNVKSMSEKELREKAIFDVCYSKEYVLESLKYIKDTADGNDDYIVLDLF